MCKFRYEFCRDIANSVFSVDTALKKISFLATSSNAHQIFSCKFVTVNSFHKKAKYNIIYQPQRKKRVQQEQGVPFSFLPYPYCR